MDWQELDAFLAVSEELHFGRAAERLGLSQARVSQMIKKLERRVGAALLDRSTRRLSLTPIGQQLLTDLRPAHRAVLDSVARARAAGRGSTGVLAVGFFGPLAGRIVLDILKNLQSTHPEIDVRIQETQIADPCQPLRENEVDLLLTQLPITELGITTGPVVLAQPQVLAVSTRHAMASRESVSLEDFATDRVLRPTGSPPQVWLDNDLPWKTPSGRPIEPGPAVHTFQELLALVAAGQGIRPVAAHNVRYRPRPDVTFIPLSDAPSFEFGLAWRNAAETNMIRVFVDRTTRLVAQWCSNNGGRDRSRMARRGEPGSLETIAGRAARRGKGAYEGPGPAERSASTSSND